MLLSVSFPAHLAVPGQTNVFLAQAGPTTLPASSTTLPGSVITITGPNVTTSSQVPGGHQDPNDLYGIVLVFIGIAVVLFGSRWLFGRKGPHPYRQQTGPTASDGGPGSTEA